MHFAAQYRKASHLSQDSVFRITTWSPSSRKNQFGRFIDHAKLYIFFMSSLFRRLVRYNKSCCVFWKSNAKNGIERFNRRLTPGRSPIRTASLGKYYQIDFVGSPPRGGRISERSPVKTKEHQSACGRSMNRSMTHALPDTGVESLISASIGRRVAYRWRRPPGTHDRCTRPPTMIVLVLGRVVDDARYIYIYIYNGVTGTSYSSVSFSSARRLGLIRRLHGRSLGSRQWSLLLQPECDNSPALFSGAFGFDVRRVVDFIQPVCVWGVGLKSGCG